MVSPRIQDSYLKPPRCELTIFAPRQLCNQRMRLMLIQMPHGIMYNCDAVAAPQKSSRRSRDFCDYSV
jgi:hypothetical protein